MTSRIILADDHAIVRQSLKLLLAGEGFHVTAEAANGAEAVELAGKLFPQIAILDIGMPVLNGIDAAREILRVSPRTKIVMLSMYGDDLYVVRALQAGVTGYVLKSRAADDLMQALRNVESGNMYISPGVSRAVVQCMLNRNNPDQEVLSPRELQVLQLIAEGHTSKAIASTVGVSPKTIESHRARMMTKLNVHETASLVMYAVRRGLVQP
jgi:DNA-binding NarL/FixJ family response regulator